MRAATTTEDDLEGGRAAHVQGSGLPLLRCSTVCFAPVGAPAGWLSPRRRCHGFSMAVVSAALGRGPTEAGSGALRWPGGAHAVHLAHLLPPPRGACWQPAALQSGPLRAECAPATSAREVSRSLSVICCCFGPVRKGHPAVFFFSGAGRGGRGWMLTTSVPP